MTSPLKKWKTTLWAPLQHTVLVQDWTTSSTTAIFRSLLECLILSTGAIQTLTSVSGWNSFDSEGHQRLWERLVHLQPTDQTAHNPKATHQDLDDFFSPAFMRCAPSSDLFKDLISWGIQGTAFSRNDVNLYTVNRKHQRLGFFVAHHWLHTARYDSVL